MVLSSQLTFLTMKRLQKRRAATMTLANTNVAVVTAKTAGPRSGTPSSVAVTTDMLGEKKSRGRRSRPGFTTTEVWRRTVGC